MKVEPNAHFDEMLCVVNRDGTVVVPELGQVAVQESPYSSTLLIERLGIN
jgi:hypothetical protein